MKFLLYIILFFPLIISCQSKYNHEPFDEKEKELRKMPDTIKQLMIDSLWQKRDSVSYLRFKNVEMIVLTETDSIPAWITKFSELKVLYASNNRTKIKSIPKDIDKLSKLVQIDLPRNNINVLPPAFFNLKKIERINLSENSLINLSENINKFKNLRVLLVADNNIKEIPISI